MTAPRGLTRGQVAHLLGLDTPPYARVERTGRWLHHVTVRHGRLSCDTGWSVWGRRWAEWKARRELARYRLRLVRKSETFEVRGDEAAYPGLLP